MESTLVAFGVAFAVMIAAVLFYSGLKTSERVLWVNIAVGTGLLLLCFGWIVVATIIDWGIIAFVQALFASAAALLSGLSLVWLLSRWRKAVGILLAIGVPLGLYLSLEVSHPYSPESLIRKNGEAIAGALNHYRSEHKTYPQSLLELVPIYLSDLNEPKTTWGWLYTSNGDSFTLGYVSYVDKMGYTVCKYSAEAPEWDCPLDYSTAPFVLAPTPMP